MMAKRWVYKEMPPAAEVEALSRTLNINAYLATVLWQRGIRDFETARLFFRPELSQLHDPFLMADMRQAVDRLHQAIVREEKILIYGDYDVDGTTAVALVYRYLRSFYPAVEYYVPDRYTEGYGVSKAGIEWAATHGYSLIIALDLGIKASDMVRLASAQGIDFIICDHHMPGRDMPQAVAVLDPKRPDCGYPYKELSGCGLGFKLMQAFARQYRQEEEVFAFLDLVAVSIASDIVPITGENRILAYYGLKRLNEQPSWGLRALKEIGGIRSDLDIGGIVFTLGPRINAAGRVAHARGAVQLLIAASEEEAGTLAWQINERNDERRNFDLSITEEALALIEADASLRTAPATVLYKPTWHKGVIGIVAARCVEKYYRPTVILTESNDRLTGSARSVHGFDLYRAIEACSDLLEKFGGHKYAAGLTLARDNFDAFRERFEQVVAEQMTDDMRQPRVEIDNILPLEAITPKFLNILQQMAPFGPEQQKPVFEARNVQVVNSLSTMKDRHIRFLAGQAGSDALLPVVGFDMIDYHPRLRQGDPFRMAFTVEENHYNGETSIQLRLRDLQFD